MATFSKEEAQVLLRLATSTDRAPHPDEVDAGAIPHRASEAVAKLYKLAGDEVLPSDATPEPSTTQPEGRHLQPSGGGAVVPARTTTSSGVTPTGGDKDKSEK